MLVSRPPTANRVSTLLPVAVSVALALGGCAEMAPPAQPESVDISPHDMLQIRRGKLLKGSGKEAQPVASVSAYCVDCHLDDLGGAEGHGGGAIMRSHPVDIEYGGASEDLVPRSELDERLLLLGGQITCVTCHDARAADHRLVMPNDQSQICRACHRR